MNTLDLAELRVWLNQTGRRDWSITPTALPSYTIISNPSHKMMILLVRMSNSQWRAELYNRKTTKNGSHIRTSGPNAVTTCQYALKNHEYP